MASATEKSRTVDAPLLDAARAELSATFPVGFDFWSRGEEWSCVCRSASPSAWVLSTDATFVCDEAITTNEPVVVESGTQVILALPLVNRPRTKLVAVARLCDISANWLRRLGETFLRSYRQRSELAALRRENEAFLRQVTNDLEELTFLRSMAELLEVSELTFDFTAMAETMLPTLKPLLDADALVLVNARHISSSCDGTQVSVGEIKVWAGLRCADEPLCIALVEHFRAASDLQPVVKTHFFRFAESEQFAGIHSFILVPIVNGDCTIGWLLALNRNNEHNPNTEDLPWDVSYLEFGTHEATLLSSSAAILATHARNVDLFREREMLLVGMVRALVSAIEAKDEYTRGHSERVALYGRRLAEELGLSDDFCQRLYLTGLLHDVGKIGVRDAVLRKAGPLTEEEFSEIKQHPDMGWQILHDLAPLAYVLPGVLHHHENFDGTGYPDKLPSNNIPLDGRILAVADAFDAMTSDRPYRKGMPQEKAEQILRSGAGTQWDPQLIAAFFRVMPEIIAIKESYQPRDPAQRRKPVAASAV